MAFLTGVALRSFFNVPNWVVWAGIGLLLGFRLALSIASAPPHRWLSASETAGARLGLAILFCLFLGILRFSFFENNLEEDGLHKSYGEEKVLQGSVLSFKNKTASSQIVLKTDLGKIMVVGRPYPQFKYGDILEIKGEIEEPVPFSDFDIKSYLAKDRIYSEMIFPDISKVGYGPESKILSSLFLVKEKFQSGLKKVLPEPHASLADGMLLGSEGMLPSNLLDAFKKTGTIHILVLSGYNITVIGAVILAFCGLFLPQTLSWIAAIIGIILFTLMSGAEPAAVRSSIMAIIGLLALGNGRLKIAMQALLCAALLMVIWNPMLLRFDRGFQLSFMATLGLILFADWFKKWLWFVTDFLSVRESASVSLAAQIFVLPLLFLWGNFVSAASPVVNVLVVGVVPAIMFFSFLGAVASFASYYLGTAIASVGYLLISYQIYIVEFFSKLNV